MTDLGAVCGGCKHRASYHPSAEQARIRAESSGGQYTPHCQDGPRNLMGSPTCQCCATREEIGAAT